MLWSLIPITLVLILIQEMGGAWCGPARDCLTLSGNGWLRITFYTMILLIITNLGNTLAEFAGIADIFGNIRSFQIPHYSPQHHVPHVAGRERDVPIRGEGLPCRVRLLCWRTSSQDFW